MQAALVFTFSRPGVGREPLGMEAFTDAFTYFGKLATDDKCEPPVLYMSRLARNMMIVHGEYEALVEIIHDPAFRELYIKAEYAAPDIGFEIVSAGESAVEEMGAWSARGAELGLF